MRCDSIETGIMSSDGLLLEIEGEKHLTTDGCTTMANRNHNRWIKLTIVLAVNY